MQETGIQPVRDLSLRSRCAAWLALSRPPFLLVGLLPYLLGALIAYASFGEFSPSVFAIGGADVALVMLSSYYAGEYWDVVEDTLVRKQGATRFSGGSGMIQMGRIERGSALLASCIATAIAFGLACILYALYGTGVLTIPLATFGLSGGLLYSSPPARWVSRGLGELWIAICYGWLPVATGFYLQTGALSAQVHLVTVPLALSIFSVILLNEFPDYHADLHSGKRNLLVRLGHEKSAMTFALVSAFAWISLVVSSLACSIPYAIPLSLPFAAISAAIALHLLDGGWGERRHLERLCGANILVNLGYTISILTGFLLWGA